MTQAADTLSEKPKRTLVTPIDRLIIAVANAVGGSKAKEVERFLKFAMIGVLGAMIDFGILNLLQSTILPPPSDTTGFSFNVALVVSISFVCAVSSNFFWNRYWTYPDSRTRSIRRQLAQFFTVSVIGWSARTLWISLSYGFLGVFVVGLLQTINPEIVFEIQTQNRIGTNVALFMGIFVVMIWNFLANRYWTYSDVD